ncbi:MAG: glycosyltransferase family 4 protein [Patescibacteria group bacterium]
MLILSNDYLSNVEKNSKVSEGGTGNFSELFSDYLLAKEHSWAGIIIDGDKMAKRIFTRKIISSSGKLFYKLLIPSAIFNSVGVGNHTLEKAFEKVIDEMVIVMKKINPDAVFLNGCYYKPWIILKAAKRLDIPVVTQHAGIMAMEAKTAYERGLTNKKKEQQLIKMEADFSKYSNIEIFLNEFSKKRYEQTTIKVDKNKAIIVPLPFFTIPFRKKNRAKKDGLKIGLVARWDGIKRHEDYLALVKMAKQQKENWDFYAITSIPDTNKNIEFKNEYRKLIKVLSPRSKRKLYDFYRQMDLMVLTSRFDVSPTVVLEAAYLGVPTAISPNVGFVEDYKKNKLDYLVCDFSNPAKAHLKIKKILDKKPPVAFFKHLMKQHDPNLILAQYLEIFKKVTQK